MSNRIQHFPVSFFSVIMGLAGFTIVLEMLGVHMLIASNISMILAYVTALIFVAITLIYVTKVFRYPGAVKAEIKHPVKISFSATFSISMLLLSTVFLKTHETVSFYLWVSGAVLHLVCTLYVLNSWLHHTHFEITHINPAWFIPVVGNILVPIAGVEHANMEICWFFFSLGFVFWVILFTIIIYRMIFHNPLPERMLPTLFILIAPPAVGFISYVKLVGHVDVFARMLFYSALFLTLLLFTQVRRFIGMPFFMSWWAYSFPLAAMTIAAFVMNTHFGGMFLILFYLLLVILAAIMLLLIVRTLIAIKRGQICVEEG